VIVQADELLALSTVIVAPTSRIARAATFRPPVEVAGELTRLLLEQLRVLDVQTLSEHVGHVTAQEQRAIDSALEIVLGLR
jgi:mRNA interferase MazF